MEKNKYEFANTEQPCVIYAVPFRRPRIDQKMQNEDEKIQLPKPPNQNKISFANTCGNVSRQKRASHAPPRVLHSETVCRLSTATRGVPSLVQKSHQSTQGKKKKLRPFSPFKKKTPPPCPFFFCTEKMMTTPLKSRIRLIKKLSSFVPSCLVENRVFRFPKMVCVFVSQ